MSDILKNFFFTWLDSEEKIKPVSFSRESGDQMMIAMEQKLNREYIDLQTMEDRQWHQDQQDYEKTEQEMEKIPFLSEFIKE